MIDLHTHTRRSDGTDTPGELMERAAQAGLSVVGLTDHDTCTGWQEAAEAVPDTGVALVRGMELTCRHAGRTVHLLGYLFNPDHPAIEAHMSRLIAARHERIVAMAEALIDDGLIASSDLDLDSPALGRPHIADALVRAGQVDDRPQAFATYIHPTSRYHRPLPAPSLAETIATIHRAGGAAVWAHPRAKRHGQHSFDAIREGLSFGLDGLEIDHRDNSPADRVKLDTLAQAYGVLKTGASDYHGSGKPNELGENCTSEEVLGALTERTELEVIYP